MNTMKESSFEAIHEGKATGLYTLENRNGMTVQVTNYGAIIVSIFVPDRQGVFDDVVQGYDNIIDYINGNGPYMGAVCGRCANRIERGRFELDGKQYSLAVNNGPNHLHGGLKGFSMVVWDVIKASASEIQLEYLSADGEENYPGNLRVTVNYKLADNNALNIEYRAVTDKATVVNLAGHSYFNLAGEGSGSIYDHELMINARYFTPVDETSIPTGEILKVEGTPLDFTVPKKIGKDIDSDFEQLHFGAGYDHNFVLNHRSGIPGLAATVYEPASGRFLEVFTTQPGLQLYTANWIDNEKGKDGKKYDKRWAFCLETQHFPDAINKPHFPSVILNPGEEYRHECSYVFSIR